jgi:hypothetical protein
VGSPWPDEAVGVESEVVEEQGRWSVYLVITIWRSATADEPFERIRRRIRDYATREEAEVGRSWMQRAAERDRRTPPTGK